MIHREPGRDKNIHSYRRYEYGFGLTDEVGHIHTNMADTYPNKQEQMKFTDCGTGEISFYTDSFFHYVFCETEHHENSYEGTGLQEYRLSDKIAFERCYSQPEDILLYRGGQGVFFPDHSLCYKDTKFKKVKK